MRVIISAGGTGGHIYPALAIIDEIKKKDKEYEILYIGTTDRMERDIVPNLGIKYEAIEIRGLRRSLSPSNLKTFTLFLKAIKKCKRIMEDFKPDIVIGAGGYVTLPVLIAANKKHIKTVIHEQNSIPGLTNKMLSKKAEKIFVSFESSASYFDSKKTVYTGNPSSESVLNTKKANKLDYGLKQSKKLVTIVMGSLGSEKVNSIMKSILPKFEGKRYEVLFVTGKSYYTEFIKNLKLPENVKVVEYINNIGGILKNTDIMVSRAGASIMMELTLLKIPTIYIPSPYVTNNHQYKNAMSLVEKNAALILEESSLTCDSLIKLIDDTIYNEEKIKEIKKNLESLSISGSATLIYNELKKIVG